MKIAPLLVVGTALTVPACGLKGPLYLPEKSGAVVTAPAAAPAAVSAPATPAQPAAVPPPPATPAPAAPAPQKKSGADQDSQTPQ